VYLSGIDDVWPDEGKKKTSGLSGKQQVEEISVAFSLLNLIK